MRRIRLIALCCVLFRSAVSTQLLCYGADGTPTPCYPPYGDVAAGLVPVATSTCSSAGPACEKCSPCDANLASQSHPASQTTDGSSDTYWQSANVSTGESANLTYNLGGVYEVMNVSVEFVGPVPNVTVLLKQADAGETFVTLLSYSAAQCGGKSTCASVAVRLVSDQIVTFAVSQSVQPAEAIRLCLYPSKGYVAVANVNVTARCACNGHASSCAKEGGYPVCNCSHNSEGRRCETCSNGYGKQPWSSNGGPTGAFVCKVCPACYQVVEQYQNTTLAVFQRFVDRMNTTLSSVDALAELARYQQLIQALLDKASFSAAKVELLHRTLSDTAVLTTMYEMNKAIFESTISTMSGMAATLSGTVERQSMLLVNLANVTDAVETLMKTTASQLQLSSKLLAETEKAFLELGALAHSADAISRDQILQTQLILGRAKNAFALASDAFTVSRLASVLQNTTVANLDALETHDLIKLNNLFSESKSYFENIRKNAPIIANESTSLLHQAIDLVVPDFHADIQYLYTWVGNLVDKSQALWNATTNLTLWLVKDETMFSVLNTTAHTLLKRSIAQRQWAMLLAGKAGDAFQLANASVQGAQDILRQALELLDQLNASLLDLSSFKSKLDGLVVVIRVAQERSDLSLGVASQANRTLLQATVIVDAAVKRTDEVVTLLTQAYSVISRANVTSSTMRNSTVELRSQSNSLYNASLVLHTDLEGLGRRAAMDCAAIANASLSANLSSSKTLEFRDRIIAANKTLFQLKAELSSIHPVPPTRFSSMNSTLNRLESEATQNQALINMTQQLIQQLEVSAKQLEDKYVTLQQQRDLLQQILNNLSNLDCRKQYS